jgi:hypothetical protein
MLLAVPGASPQEPHRVPHLYGGQTLFLCTRTEFGLPDGDKDYNIYRAQPALRIDIEAL